MPKRCRSEAGMTVVELLAVLLIIAIILGTGMSSLGQLRSPLRDGSQELLGFMKQARARAVATTSAYTVQPVSSTRVRAFVSSSCSSADLTMDPRLVLELPSGAFLSATDWSVCFNSRGMAQASEEITIGDREGRVRTLEIFMGGALRFS